MEYLISYDITTETPEGRRRLRRVAKVCEGFGQRVQQSVFECALSPMNLDRLEAELLGVIDDREDSVRIYRLREPRHRYVRALGRQLVHDVHHPLVL